ncbi:ComEC family competence protein [uncultured Clostridium sp.]|uniref:ComEC/Rec2 family competence protein n=1 Tax=uncultured Clostridium sp. TaxID=59620 RepID=UPI000820F117|nr:ComEC/Rec2 family competence protein [uncultured Clostridium sp.]SCJ97008.1 ComEC family competence protein [uncultured Clostridium sp.]
MRFFKILPLIFIILLCSCTLPHSNSTQLMEIHYIDVGQGDAILVQVNDKNLLIDSGPKESSSNLFNYLHSLNINKLDYVIATHPHEDHIGNMYSVIKKFDIGEFFAPKVTHSSKSFERMVESLISKNKKINVFDTNTTSINLGENIYISTYSPSKKDYGNNLNLYSTVFRIQYGNTSFLFTGDAEKNNEDEILNSYSSIRSNVLKIAHHGSSTSTSQAFLEAVNPEITIISVGSDNSYNHPNSKILNLLNSIGTKVYRTDKDSTIILISDGTNIYKKTSYK